VLQRGIIISINQLPIFPDISLTMLDPWDSGALDG
jgi:hypothetical protein